MTAEKKAQVISAVQRKGGVGKSTIICGLAAWVARDGAKVLIIDTDPQLTCSRWEEKKEVGVDLVDIIEDEKLAPAVLHYQTEYDVIFIDTAGYKSAIAVYAISLSDVVFISSKASEPDADGAIRTWNHVKSVGMTAAKAAKPYVVLTDVDRNAAITQIVKSAIAGQGAEIIDKPLWGRTGFKEMHSRGGLPDGGALTVLREFIANLQIRSLIEFYQAKEA